jgi:hypothetical protein
MSIQLVTEAIQTELAAVGVTGVSFAFGGEHIPRLESPPRVVWVPRGGPGSAPEKSSYNPRPLRTRNVSVEAHVWGADYAATESLLNSLLAATHRALHGSYEFTSEQWPDMNAELLAYGRVVIVSMVFRIPVTDVPVPTALIQHVETTTPSILPPP